MCQPYHTETKGKVERFNGYLKGNFCVPLATTLKQAGLRFDVTAANAHSGRWLTEVADQRLHGTARERPAKRLQEEHLALVPLPVQHGILVPAAAHIASDETIGVNRVPATNDSILGAYRPVRLGAGSVFRYFDYP